MQRRVRTASVLMLTVALMAVHVAGADAAAPGSSRWATTTYTARKTGETLALQARHLDDSKVCYAWTVKNTGPKYGHDFDCGLVFNHLQIRVVRDGHEVLRERVNAARWEYVNYHLSRLLGEPCNCWSPVFSVPSEAWLLRVVQNAKTLPLKEVQAWLQEPA